jgi:hypothetical protein
MAVPSKTTICNKALIALGARGITDIDSDTTPNGVKARELYDRMRDDLLRDHPWNFAIKRVILAPDVETPPFGFKHQFSLPGDFLRAIEVGRPREFQSYRIEGKKILCDGDSLKLVYVFHNTNEATWDSSFIGLMIQAMIYALCYPVTQSPEKEAQEYQIFQNMKQRARSIDGMENPPQKFGDNPFYEARFL